jgi:hypothetical protein
MDQNGWLKRALIAFNNGKGGVYHSGTFGLKITDKSIH